MGNILNKLYYGKISPYEKISKNDKEYMELVQKLYKAEQELEKTSINKGLLEKYIEINGEITEFHRKAAFINGLRLGLGIGIELFTEQDEE